MSITILLSVELSSTMGQTKDGFDPHYQVITSGDLVQDKNFYLLTLMEYLPEVRDAIRENEQLKAIFEYKRKALLQAADTCQYDIPCYTAACKWDTTEVKAILDILNSMWNESEALRAMVTHHMRPSGYFQFLTEMSDSELLQATWQDAAEGMNYIIDVYALGGSQRYPHIDSATYVVNSTFYKRLIDNLGGLLSEQAREMELFFQPSLAFAKGLLDINHRDEAARFEPLHALENRAAVERIPNIKWDEYTYSLILIPGRSPIYSHVRLSPAEKIRNTLGAARYHAGLAPIIVVSGGYVHPFQTRYCEALEMKRDLMERHQIPGHAILIDPHARHTTTNFRNTARMIYQYGIPAEKKALVTTSKYQSYYITDMGLDERCLRELGYIPFTLSERLNKHDVEWLPQINALHRDSLDPLDP